MKIEFIHIGMMKTATTYMQNVWLKDDSYCLSHQGSIPFLLELREYAIKNEMSYSPSKQIQLDQQYRPGQKIVVSNESFSCSFLNQPEHQSRTPDFIDFTSKSLAGFAKKTENVLIVVRDPLTWIRSIFVQSIKQGGKGSLQDFMSEQMDFLKHSLDIENILDKYGRYFSNILILPYELFRRDEAKFWATISDEFKVPLVTAKIDKKVNTSLSDDRTYYLSELNKLASFIVNVIKESPTYENEAEKKHLVSRFSNDFKWLYRRFMEHATEDELTDLKSLMKGAEFSQDYFATPIPDELSAHIDKKFIHCLKGKIDDSIISSYLSS